MVEHVQQLHLLLAPLKAVEVTRPPSVLLALAPPPMDELPVITLPNGLRHPSLIASPQPLIKLPSNVECPLHIPAYLASQLESRQEQLLPIPRELLSRPTQATIPLRNPELPNRCLPKGLLPLTLVRIVLPIRPMELALPPRLHRLRILECPRHVPVTTDTVLLLVQLGLLLPRAPL